jgi:hypothetical protein
MSSSKIENLVRQSFDELYRQRVMKLTGVMLSDLLRKQNLYLLCATSGSSVSKIIEKMLEAYITLSDESIFGQAFFESISSIEREEMAVPGGKSNVAYKAITLINVVHYIPIQSWIEFDDEWAKALNRLHYDFYNNFSKDDGNIDWEKLLRFNSGEDNIPWVSKVILVTTEDQEDESNEDEVGDVNYGNEDYA